MLCVSCSKLVVYGGLNKQYRRSYASYVMLLSRMLCWSRRRLSLSNYLITWQVSTVWSRLWPAKCHNPGGRFRVTKLGEHFSFGRWISNAQFIALNKPGRNASKTKCNSDFWATDFGSVNLKTDENLLAVSVIIVINYAAFYRMEKKSSRFQYEV